MFCVNSPLPPYDGSWARLIPMKDGTIGFESLYDPDLVDDLKEQIPWRDRRWDRDQKLWFVAPKWAETLANLAVKHKMGRPQVPRVTLLECGHYETIENYPIKPWPGHAYCSICEMTVLTDAHRRDIEEDAPWDSVG